MLTIRERQFVILGRRQQVRFEDSLLRRFAWQYPTDYASLGEAGARELIRHTVAFGASRGIQTEGAVSALLELFVEYGRNLEMAPCRPWAMEILEHPRLAGQVKVAMVRDRLSSFTQGRRIVRQQEPASPG